MLDEVWRVIRDANRQIDADAPWALRKTDPARMASVLYVLMETIRHVAIVLQPVMPHSCARILDQLAVPPDRRDFGALRPGNALRSGAPLPGPQPVFPRFVEAEGETARA
jgi:methionyl-tRNA synthetase